jgi:hypothetical protein
LTSRRPDFEGSPVAVRAGLPLVTTLRVVMLPGRSAASACGDREGDAERPQSMTTQSVVTRRVRAPDTPLATDADVRERQTRGGRKSKSRGPLRFAPATRPDLFPPRQWTPSVHDVGNPRVNSSSDEDLRLVPRDGAEDSAIFDLNRSIRRRRLASLPLHANLSGEPPTDSIGRGGRFENQTISEPSDEF